MLYLLLTTLSFSLPLLQPFLSPLAALHFFAFIFPALFLIAETPRNTCAPLSVCSSISIIPFPPELLPYWSHVFHPITYFTLGLFHFLSLSILTHAGASLFAGCLSALLHSSRLDVVLQYKIIRTWGTDRAKIWDYGCESKQVSMHIMVIFASFIIQWLISKQDRMVPLVRCSQYRICGVMLISVFWFKIQSCDRNRRRYS